MRRLQDGDQSGADDPPTRVDFWKRERVPEPPSAHHPAGGARRTLEGGVTIDRIVAGSPSPAGTQATPTDGEHEGVGQAEHTGSALDWRQPDVPAREAAGAGTNMRLWASGRFAALRAAARTGAGFAQARADRRAWAALATAIPALVVAVLLVDQLSLGGSGGAPRPRVSAAAIGGSGAASTTVSQFHKTLPVLRHHRERVRRKHRPQAHRTPAHHATRQLVSVSSVAQAPQTPPPSTSTSTTAPASSPSGSGSSPSGSGDHSPSGSGGGGAVGGGGSGGQTSSSAHPASTHQPAFGMNGSLGPGHGDGTG